MLRVFPSASCWKSCAASTLRLHKCVTFASMWSAVGTRYAVTVCFCEESSRITSPMRCVTPSAGAWRWDADDGVPDLEVTVFDTGPGIPSDQQKRIYGEFHRLEKGSPWGEQGLGLGLSICDRLARLLSHELSLQSHPARGSAFGVRVARAARPMATSAAQPPTPPADPVSLTGLRVLCVDNDAAILDGMEALLGLWGMLVVKARSGRRRS